LNSPGHTATRLFHELGAILASHGYVVVSVDHYDVSRTVFPDGTYLQGDTVSQMSEVGTEDRVRDLGFILDELVRWNTNDPVFAGRLDLAKVAAMGGSWGAGTAAEFCRRDSRCKAVVDLDGGPGTIALIPLLGQLGVQKPLLEIHNSKTQSSEKTLYNKNEKDAIWFLISNSDHLLIAGAEWYWAWHTNDVAGGREVARTINAYSLWFLNKYLKGSTDPLPVLADYPRVTGFVQK